MCPFQAIRPLVASLVSASTPTMLYPYPTAMHYGASLCYCWWWSRSVIERSQYRLAKAVWQTDASIVYKAQWLRQRLLRLSLRTGTTSTSHRAVSSQWWSSSLLGTWRTYPRESRFSPRCPASDSKCDSSNPHTASNYTANSTCLLYEL